MPELLVGVRDLKAHLSEYLHKVRGGQVVVVTDHGKVVARILPVEQDLDERLQAMQAAGLLVWNGQRLADIEAPAVNTGPQTLSDLITEMRE
jgi:prevent-host-death family protein